MLNNIVKALIYCRVSDTKQKTEGSGLESQEHRCRAFAKEQGFVVDRIFHDDVSGGGNYNKRPAMMMLLEHVRQNKNQNYVLILDDIKRISRDVYFYWDLIRRLDEFDVQPMSPNFIFAQTPEGRFQQSITVAAGEYERESIARQTRQKTQARLEAGFHAFNAPVGFKFVKTKERGKILQRDEPAASAIEEMLNGFASRRFQTREEARRFLENHPDFPKSPTGRIGNNQADKIINDPLYAGYIKYEPWNITLRKGQHDGIISFETYQKNLDILNARPIVASRPNVSEDFPLRNTIACECGNSFTSCYSTSRTGRLYPYYICQNRLCKYKGKSIRKEVMEAQFEEVLKKLTPSRPLIDAAEAMFRMIWDHMGASQKYHKAKLAKECADIDKQINDILDRIVDSNSSKVIQAFEKRIDKLEVKKLLLEEKMENLGTPRRPFHAMYRTALQYLSNPYEVWHRGNYAQKRLVQKLTFTDRIGYDRETGYRTPEVSAPFRFLEHLTPREKMVPRGGIEPPTRGFSIRCSTD